MLCHAPVQDAALFSRPCGPPELKRNRPKTQRTPDTTTQHSDAAADGTVAQENMLEGDSTAKVQLSQPVSALPGRRNRGSQPRVKPGFENPPSKPPHSTRLPPPLATRRHTRCLGRSAPPKSCTYDPCQPSLGVGKVPAASIPCPLHPLRRSPGPCTRRKQLISRFRDQATRLTKLETTVSSGPWSRSKTGLMIGSIFFGRNIRDWSLQITFKTGHRKCFYFSQFCSGRSFFLDPNNLTIEI